MDRFSSCCSDVLIYLWYVNSIQSSFCRSINVWKHQFAIGQQLPCKIITHIVSTCVVIIFYKCSEKCAQWLVRTSSLYFHEARALRHTSVLLRYNARSLRHRYELAQFTTHFLKEKKNCSSSIVELCKHLWIFKNTREVLEALAFGSCFSALPRVLKNSQVLI